MAYSPRVDGVQVVSAFELDTSIVLTLGPKLKELQRTMGGQLVTLNVPEGAPPYLPRVALSIKHALVNIGLTRFEFRLEPPPHIAHDFAEVIRYASNRIKPVIQKLASSGTAYEWTGAVVNVEYPENPMRSQNSVEASRPLFSRLVSLAWDVDDLAAFDLKVGYHRGSFYRSYHVSGFERKEIDEFIPAGSGPITIDLGSIKSSEAGFQVAIDINNKPASKKRGPVHDFNSVLKEQSLAFSSMATDLNLEGLL